MDWRRSQSALCRHLAGPRGARGPPPLRKALLRPRRDGKPHQGMSARPLCRPHLGPHDARQPAAAVVCRDGLCPDQRLAPHRPDPHAIRPRLVRHDPPQAPQDRGAGAYQCAPHQARDALGLPLSGRVPRRPCRAHRRRTLTPTRKHGENNPATRPRIIALQRTRKSCTRPPQPTTPSRFRRSAAYCSTLGENLPRYEKYGLIDGVPAMPQPNDLSRSLVALDQNSTIIAVIEMSQSSWLVAGMLPGIERQPRKKLDPSPERLLGLLHRWRDEAVRAGRTITRIALAFEAGRDGFWLARWLAAHGVEAHVIHASSVAVSREHRRAKTDRLDTELLKRGFLGWLRGE